MDRRMSFKKKEKKSIRLLFIPNAHLGEYYGIITKKYERSFWGVACSDGKERKAINPGRFRPLWLDKNDHVLISLLHEETFIIQLIYTPEEIIQIKSILLKKRIKSLIRIIGRLTMIYNIKCEQRYSPGGSGYDDAHKNFLSLTKVIQ
ncbi:MAG: hypothetical protein Hyperionvirus1_146 [Hyperionvirus sp.]|uniref:Uncharacterized protein n=1 Tax=Hyperionvirus sp. TaxID=2487770 RepID=A0A3G5A5Q9_9VIRU|nr:MAG: hypothetical protein Hyperionvirus1_146 [Hyperionvirus sp.]